MFYGKLITIFYGYYDNDSDDGGEDDDDDGDGGDVGALNVWWQTCSWIKTFPKKWFDPTFPLEVA